MNDQTGIAANTAEDEALSWLVDFDDLSLQEQQQFTAWLGERPENGAVFEKLERQWRRLDVLQRLATEAVEPNVIRKPVRTNEVFRRLVPIAAATAIVGIGAALWALLPSTYEAEYQTAIGQHQQIVLPDDSVITLNTNSGVAIHYSATERRVHLERGEAYFVVAESRERPFSVIAGTGTVRAVGTSFNVYRKGDLVEVTVTEGVVKVLTNVPPADKRESPGAHFESAAAPVETLAEGHKLEYREAIESVSKVAPEAIARKLAWQVGMLHFEGETLSEVIREASRYTSTRITIVDPELEGLHVSGYFRAGDIDTLIGLIDSNELVTVRRVSPQVVNITTTRH